jgi:hypothetical protein
MLFQESRDGIPMTQAVATLDFNSFHVYCDNALSLANVKESFSRLRQTFLIWLNGSVRAYSDVAAEAFGLSPAAATHPSP